MRTIINVKSNLRGNYECYYYGVLICEAKTLESLMKKASKYFKGQNL